MEQKPAQRPFRAGGGVIGGAEGVEGWAGRVIAPLRLTPPHSKDAEVGSSGNTEHQSQAWNLSQDMSVEGYGVGDRRSSLP